MPSHRFARSSLLAAALLTVSSLFAQSASAPDAASLVTALSTADAAQAKILLDRLAPDQLPAFLLAFNPADLRPDAHDAILDQIDNLARRVRTDRAQKKIALEAEWDTRTGLQAYQATGQHNPAWDALAIDALSHNDAAHFAQSAKAYKAALDAGCTDPLIRYYAVRRNLIVKSITPAEALTQYLAILPDLDKSPYSPFRRFQLRIQILSLCTTSPAALAAAKSIFDSTVDMLPSLADERPGPLALHDAAEIILTASQRLHRGNDVAFHKISPALHALLPNSAYPFYYDARFYTDWAWEARGSGFANTVTEEGWKGFHERLAAAQAAAIAGFNLDPLDPDCPTQMITICMGLSSSRDLMEQWFARATCANPDAITPCIAKFNFLLPKWGGGPTDAVDFGRECLRRGTTNNRIPWVLVDIHNQLANDSGDPDAYYAQPEVWTDISAVYKKFLADNATEVKLTNLRTDHAWYVHYAFQCKQWQSVVDLSTQFKDDVNYSVIGGKAIYDYECKSARENLAKPPA